MRAHWLAIGVLLVVAIWGMAVLDWAWEEPARAEPIEREKPSLAVVARVQISATEEVLLLDVPSRRRTKPCFVYRDTVLGVNATCLP